MGVPVFPCTGCGLCCQRMHEVFDNLKELRKYPVMFNAVVEFPHDIRKDGSCSKFIDGKCSVYEDRPLLCNVQKLGEIMQIDLMEWYKANATACNAMIRAAGIDEAYLVDV